MRTFTLAVLAVVFSAAALRDARAANYQPLSVRDFAIDAEALTRASARVEITGAYALAGNLDQLYGAANDVMLAREGIASPPSIPLLIDHASRELRAAIFDCRSSGAYFCMLTVRGVAEKCTITSAFGVAHETPCIAVDDGGNYRPPPLTAEQVAELQAQAAAAQQRHAAELAEQVSQWNQTVEDVSSTHRWLTGTPL